MITSLDLYEWANEQVQRIDAALVPPDKDEALGAAWTRYTHLPPVGRTDHASDYYSWGWAAYKLGYSLVETMAAAAINTPGAEADYWQYTAAGWRAGAATFLDIPI